ncbi:MAG: double zinc ribbon domain-containing protein [Rhodospirillales bacterium]
MSETGALAETFNAAGRVLLDWLLPPRCPACGAEVQGGGDLCGDCYPKMTFLDEPLCQCCGLPFPYETGLKGVCGACARQQPRFQRARAALVYDDASRGMILALKHADRTDLVPAFARWMARAGRPLLAEADLILPVPLHWSRLMGRRFNQSAELARALSRMARRPFCPGLLRRKRRTRPQGHLSRRGRIRNVAGAFHLAPGAAGRIQGKRVLLIDDVLTTGATAESCAKVLLRGGAAAVDVLTLARVVLEQ